MKAYSGTIKKKDFIKEIKWHQEQDKIVQGTYGNEVDGTSFRACAVGCSIHSINRLKGTEYDTSTHKLYETELGIPEWLARLEDTIFEGLPAELAKQWPLRFSRAIKVGVDLEPVKWQFTAFVLSENIERVLSLDINDDLKKQVVDAIRGVLVVTEDAIQTGVWDDSAAKSARLARLAAWSAAESAGLAAWSAAWSAAESAGLAAESAVHSAAHSADSAVHSARSAARSAWSAAESAAGSAGLAAGSAGLAARLAAYERYADKLIELIKAVRV